ncbi:MAG: hypothetical protein ACW99J_18490, partial [Candidatus Thorarchaeota archaeon]
ARRTHPLESAWGRMLNINIGDKDVAALEAGARARLRKKALKLYAKNNKLTRQERSDVSLAILAYADTVNQLQTKWTPEAARAHIKEWYNKAAKNDPQMGRALEMAHNFGAEYEISKGKKINTDGLLWMAGEMHGMYEYYKHIGLEERVIRNTVENFVNRQWDLAGQKSKAALTKFNPRTRHAMPRLFDTIAQGTGMGYKLKIRDAVDALHQYEMEMIKAIGDARLLAEMKRAKDSEGNKLASDSFRPGYERITHPNMRIGHKEIWVPKNIAKDANAIFGTSALYSLKGIKDFTKLNATVKAWVLQSSFFHHLAFLRSYALPSTVHYRNLRPIKAYRDGMKAIEQADPILMHGVRNSLTIGLKQDWLDTLVREPTHLGRWLDKNKATKRTKDAITWYRDTQTNFLFGEMGPAFKAITYINEFKKWNKKYGTGELDMTGKVVRGKEGPNIYSQDYIARRVAEMINNDFGGLHLQRLKRNPTAQHIYRLFLLAPDWTESNVRTMVKLFSGDKFERELYRHFWSGVVVKGLGMTAIANFILAGGDINEMKSRYKTAWKEGNLKWLQADVTPIYKMFGGNPRMRKYFPVIGHFIDPVKFAAHPLTSAKHKGAIVTSSVAEAFSGTDYAGRHFTTFGDLMKEGKTVKWGGTGSVNYETFPAWFLSQVGGSQPVQFQAFVAWMMGEIDGFDAVSRSLGLRTTSTYPKKRKGGRRRSRPGRGR